MFYYYQLCGAIGALKNNGYQMDYQELKQKLINICKRMGDDLKFLPEDEEEIYRMHQEYRKICIQNGFTKIGHLFRKDDCAIIA